MVIEQWLIASFAPLPPKNKQVLNRRIWLMRYEAFLVAEISQWANREANKSNIEIKDGKRIAVPHKCQSAFIYSRSHELPKIQEEREQLFDWSSWIPADNLICGPAL